MMWGFDGHWGWAAAGMFWMVLFWGSLIALAVWAVRSLSGRSEEAPRDTPEEIARRRYARGEISNDQLQDILRHLHA